jgi:hypothetical protein
MQCIYHIPAFLFSKIHCAAFDAHLIAIEGRSIKVQDHVDYHGEFPRAEQREYKASLLLS